MAQIDDSRQHLMPSSCRCGGIITQPCGEEFLPLAGPHRHIYAACISTVLKATALEQYLELASSHMHIGALQYTSSAFQHIELSIV